MIKSKCEMKRYMVADFESRMGSGWRPSFGAFVKAWFLPEPWFYVYLLRKTEYSWNRRAGGVVGLIVKKIRSIRLQCYGARCGYEIPVNVCGPGLNTPHRGTLIITSEAKIGSNARIHAGVNIGAWGNEGSRKAPRIGNNVYIGPGAKIFGPVDIGDNVAIGANAVVSKSVPDMRTVVGVNRQLPGGSVDMVKYGDASCMPFESTSCSD